MPLDPQVKAILEAMAQMELDHFERISTFTPVTLRAALDAQRMPLPPEPVAQVEDRVVPGPGGDVPVRIYRPSTSPDPLPVVVFFHGGGWVFGDLETHDATCRSLANLSGAMFVAVDYRLAPEHPFPGPLEDCDAVTRWVVDNAAAIGADATRVAVAGDSAGGNLAAAVALKARDRGTPDLVFQLLVYPCTDADTSPYESYRQNRTGYFLTTETMEWFHGHYFGDADRNDHYAAPIKAADLGGLPPAMVITAEFDPLRDEGEAYAARLRDAGVPVEAVRFDGQIHGFFSMTSMIDAAKDAQVAAAEALRKAFA